MTHFFKYHLNPMPGYNTSDFSGAHYYSKTSHSRLPRCTTTNAENKPILQMHFQEITEW